MRTAITVGILKNGEAEIIHHPTTSMDKQRAAFRDMGAAKRDSKYVEIRYIPSRGRTTSRRFASAKGGVNHNAANRVADQGKKKTMVDFAPVEGKTGRVNFGASMKVADQGKKKAPAAPPADGTHGRVNFDASIKVAEQGKPKKTGKASRKAAEAAKKSAETAHTPSGKVESSPAKSPSVKAENSSSDSDPKL